MASVLEKTERRLGEKLFLKGDRCLGPKCAVMRRSYPPGAHGKSRRRRDTSEYGSLLREKMKMRYYYNLDDRAIKTYAEKAALKKGIFHQNMLRAIEARLDNIVFRAGLAASRRQARQAVSHGHIWVNGRKVKIPSYEVQTGETVAVASGSLKTGLFDQIRDRLRSFESPRWMTLDKESLSVKMSDFPEVQSGDVMIDVTKVKEFYSR